MMSRIGFWISAVPGVSDVLIIAHANGSEEFYPLVSPQGNWDRPGSSYAGQFQGVAGTYYDLPRGFPTNNADAASRLTDPSLSSTLRSLIQLNFPLGTRGPARAYSRRTA